MVGEVQDRYPIPKARNQKQEMGDGSQACPKPRRPILLIGLENNPLWFNVLPLGPPEW